jgi:capsular exopolysaccharide synthesis family protein
VEGLRTLLVDADLRLPTIGKALIGPNDQSEGLTDVLAGNCDVEHCIRETAVKNLFALVAGRRAPNPSELLGSGRFDELIGKLSGQFDRIVIDSAPINAVSDSLRICASAHYVCLIVQSGRTPKRAVFRALRLIDNAGGRIAGFVLNRTSFGRGSGYYYYYYGDSYAKESVYGTPSAAKAN